MKFQSKGQSLSDQVTQVVITSNDFVPALEEVVLAI